MVKVLFSSALRSVTKGESEIDIEHSGDIASLLQILSNKYGDTFSRRVLENGTLRKFINVYLDGRDIRFLSGLETGVSGPSEVLFLPAVSGG